jgi:hypothetical protein
MSCRLRFSMSIATTASRSEISQTSVIAPSRVARQPADRIKADRRDALLLARLLRTAELTPIVVPVLEDEAIRDLVRTREDAMHDGQRARSCDDKDTRLLGGVGDLRTSYFCRRLNLKIQPIISPSPSIVWPSIFEPSEWNACSLQYARRSVRGVPCRWSRR